jgi:hypothetical protein
LRVGNICDAQDYLGNWHIGICIDDNPQAASKQMHFLPYNKANRDEAFTSEDNSRLAPLYSKTSSPADKNVKLQFTTLKTYMDNYRTKLGKVKAEEITAASLQTQPAPATNKQQ